MKKGSTIVESIVSLSIILISVTIAIQISIITSKSIKLREEKEKANRVAYAIENEIKYNLTMNDVKNIFKDSSLNFKYRDDIIEFLSENSLLLLENGENIIIEKLREETIEGKPIEEKYKIYVLKIKVLNSKRGIIVEREFIKSYWMDI